MCKQDCLMSQFDTLISDNSMALVHLDDRQLEFRRIFQENLRTMEESQKQREQKLQQVNSLGKMRWSSLNLMQWGQFNVFWGI